MARFTGAETVTGGYYLNVGQTKLEVIEGASGVLPGDGGVRYMRIPVIAMIVLAPLMGLLFVLLVPFIGIAVVIEQVGLKAYSLAAAGRARLAHVISHPRR